jgi:hypothetical protein
LPSIGWRTGQSGAPPDSHCICLVHDLLPFLTHPTVGPRGQLAHRTLSGAYRTVRCAQPTVAAGHASPADRAADRWLTGLSGVNYSRTPLRFPEISRFTAGQPGAPDTVRCTTGQSGVPDRAGVGCTQPTLSLFFSSSFVTVSST